MFFSNFFKILKRNLKKLANFFSSWNPLHRSHLQPKMNNIRFCTLVGLLSTKLSHYLIVLDYVHLVGLLLTKLSHYLIVYNHTNMFLAIQSDIKNRWHCLFKLGTLSNHGVNVKENITWRYMFALFPLLRGFKNSFNLYNVAELFWNRIGRNRVQVETETEKFAVVCSRSPQNLKFSHFTLLFCRERRKDVSTIITHVQGLCFAP